MADKNGDLHQRHIVIDPSGNFNSTLMLPGGIPVSGSPGMPASPATVQGLIAGKLTPSAPLLAPTMRRQMEKAPPHCECLRGEGRERP
jgi:hypothetical protein